MRRCHGDLHLANIVLWQGRPVLFDAIEFDEAMATIDTLYDLAFLLMDLDCRGQRRRPTSCSTATCGARDDDLDLAGLVALPLFLALRAAIRAMVTAERAARRAGGDASATESAATICRRHWTYVAPASRLIAVGGLSGTGKRRLAPAWRPSSGRRPAPCT